MKIIVLGAAGRMGSMHARHLIEMGHEIIEIDPKLPPILSNKYPEHWPWEKADGVVIATPAERHHQDINAAINAGLHIFVEKPICLIEHIASVKNALAAVRETGNALIVAVGYNLRFHPQVMAVKNQIASGALRPMWGSFLLRQKPQRQIGHFLEEWASHEIDLALHLLGAAEGHVRRINCASDQLQCVVEHTGGLSFIHADAWSEPFRRAFTIVDQDGASVTCDIESDHVQEANYRSELLDWIDQIQWQNRAKWNSPLATGEDGLAAIELLAKANR